MLLGIDLDHTLVDYRVPLRKHAEALGICVEEGASLKEAVRAHCRTSAEGDAAWQRVQADIYGAGMVAAKVADGGRGVLSWLAEEGVPVVIVSHKSEHAAAGQDGPNLRECALEWMRGQGLFSGEYGLSAERVFFEGTRAEKVARIGALGCTHFIDDLELVFQEPGFPEGTERILLGAGGDWKSAANWTEVRRILEEELEQELRSLAAAHVTPAVERLELLTGGRNSRVYKVCAGDGTAYAIKICGSLHAPTAPDQERLVRESMALGFLKDGLRLHDVPVMHRFVPSRSMLLMEYVEGGPAVENIGDADIDAAVDFIGRLNGDAGAMELWQFPASEAVFTLDEVRENIRERAAALRGGEERGPLHEEMLSLVFEEIVPFVDKMRFQGEGLSMVLPEDYRILSPSDFGFHNAIRRGDGSLVFIDFEHFGWDDPAKLVCDFLWHPAMPLTDAQRQRFVTGVAHGLEMPRLLASRLPAAYALFGLKWSLILLNEFLPVHWRRRRLAGQGRPREEVLRMQLDKARDYAVRAIDSWPRCPFMP